MSAAGTQVASLYVTVRADTSDVNRGMAQTRREVDQTEESLKSVDQRARQLRAGFLVSAAAATGLGYAIAQLVRRGSAVQSTLATVRATSGATAAEMGKIQQKVLDLGAAFPVTMLDAAQAMQELSFAGFSVRESMAAVTGVAELASASTLNVAQSARLVSSSINQFALDASQAELVAGSMAAAFASSATTMEEMGAALQYAGAAASTAGQDLSETTAIIASMSERGLRGSMAGTSLQQMLTSLVNPSQDAKDALAQIGLDTSDFQDANGDMKDMSQIVQTLAGQMGDLPEAEKLRILNEVFGIRGGRAASILISDPEGVMEQLATVQGGQIATSIQGLDRLDPEALAQRSEAVGFELRGDMNQREVLEQYDQLANRVSQRELAARIQVGLNVEEGAAEMLAGDLAGDMSVADVDKALTSITTAGELTEAQMDTIGGKIEYISGSLDSLGYGAFEGFKPLLGTILDGLIGVLDVLTAHPAIAQAAGVALFTMAGGATAAAVALGVMWAQLAISNVLTAEGASKTFAYQAALKAKAAATWLAQGATTVYNAALAGNLSALAASKAAEAGSIGLKYGKAAATGVATAATYAYRAAILVSTVAVNSAVMTERLLSAALGTRIGQVAAARAATLADAAAVRIHSAAATGSAVAQRALAFAMSTRVGQAIAARAAVHADTAALIAHRAAAVGTAVAERAMAGAAALRTAASYGATAATLRYMVASKASAAASYASAAAERALFSSIVAVETGRVSEAIATGRARVAHAAHTVAAYASRGATLALAGAQRAYAAGAALATAATSRQTIATYASRGAALAATAATYGYRAAMLGVSAASSLMAASVASSGTAAAIASGAMTAGGAAAGLLASGLGLAAGAASTFLVAIGPIGWILLAIGAIAIGIKTNFLGMGDAWNWLVGVVSGAAGAVLAPFRFIGSAARELGESLGWVADKTGAFFGLLWRFSPPGMIQWALEAVGGVGALGDGVGWAKDKVGAFFGLLWRFSPPGIIQWAFNAVGGVKALGGGLGWISDKVGGFFRLLWRFSPPGILQWALNAAGGFDTLAAGLGAVTSPFQTMWGYISKLMGVGPEDIPIIGGLFKKGKKEGQKMGEGVASGANEKKGLVGKAVGGVMGAAAKYLPSSNAQAGPLRNLKQRGRALPGTFAAAVRGNLGAVENAAGAVGQRVARGLPGARAAQQQISPFVNSVRGLLGRLPDAIPLPSLGGGFGQSVAQMINMRAGQLPMPAGPQTPGGMTATVVPELQQTGRGLIGQVVGERAATVPVEGRAQSPAASAFAPDQQPRSAVRTDIQQPPTTTADVDAEQQRPGPVRVPVDGFARQRARSADLAPDSPSVTAHAQPATVPVDTEQPPTATARVDTEQPPTTTAPVDAEQPAPMRVPVDGFARQRADTTALAPGEPTVTAHAQPATVPVDTEQPPTATARVDTEQPAATTAPVNAETPTAEAQPGATARVPADGFARQTVAPSEIAPDRVRSAVRPVLDGAGQAVRQTLSALTGDTATIEAQAVAPVDRMTPAAARASAALRSGAAEAASRLESGAQTLRSSAQQLPASAREGVGVLDAMSQPVRGAISLVPEPLRDVAGAGAERAGSALRSAAVTAHDRLSGVTANLGIDDDIARLGDRAAAELPPEAREQLASIARVRGGLLGRQFGEETAEQGRGLVEQIGQREQPVDERRQPPGEQQQPVGARRQPVAQREQPVAERQQSVSDRSLRARIVNGGRAVSGTQQPDGTQQPPEPSVTVDSPAGEGQPTTAARGGPLIQITQHITPSGAGSTSSHPSGKTVGGKVRGDSSGLQGRRHSENQEMLTTLRRANRRLRKDLEDVLRRFGALGR